MQKIHALAAIAALAALPAVAPAQAMSKDTKPMKTIVQVAADIAASNGVIHVIDTVLLPAAAPVPAGR